jgi:hypothetical protein
MKKFAKKIIGMYLLTISCLHGSIPNMIQYPERYSEISYALNADVKKKKKKGKKIGGAKGKKSKKGFFSKIFGSK